MQMSEQLTNPQSIKQDFAIPGRVMLHTLSEALNNRRQQLAELGCRIKDLLNLLCKFVYI
jgi:3,4-dihydroxy-2-butanone 4-phosphate synthase